VIDIPFATFVYAKLLGKFNFLEDLPSLDPQYVIILILVSSLFINRVFYVLIGFTRIFCF
jgi:hypothetical protein